MPIATMRPPRARAALMRAAASALTSPHSACIAMLARVVDLDRQKRAGADMQRYCRPLDAARGERGEQGRGEMQARGRRGDGALGAGEDRLVIAAVAYVDRRGAA